MHIVLIRHCTRIDKSKPGISPGQSIVSLDKENIRNDDVEDSSNWLSNFDPPLNGRIASEEMSNAFKKISNDVLNKNQAKKVMIHSSPYNRCIQTSELLLNKLLHGRQPEEKVQTKLRVDQALSEWLNENYNLKYLPPNDDGYSMINNVNAYLNQPNFASDKEGIFTENTKDQLRNVKDSTWSYNQLGHCGEYGESASEFTTRCFNYLINLLQYYYTKQGPDADREMVVFIISHGAVISTLLQILLGRPVFSEIPLCTPIYFKQSQKRRSVFKLMDYDFNLNKLLGTSTDQEFYKILDKPIDLTKLDPDNLRSELTIGTTGYTTIIQSIPKPLDSPKLGLNTKSKTIRRRRRNTINIGDKEKDNVDETNIETLKQTRSSKQLYLLNKNTKDEKVIDLDKLHSYFGGSDSNSSDDEYEDHVDANKLSGDSNLQNVFKGSITSLSSFNEENKSKFQLNMKNFFSKPSPITSDPFSHFYLNRSSTVEDEISDFDEFNSSGRNTQCDAFSNSEVARDSKKSNMFTMNVDSDTDSETDDEHNITNNNNNDTSSTESSEHILSFGKRDRLNNLIISENKKEDEKRKLVKDDNKELTTVLSGTFRNISLGSNNNLNSKFLFGTEDYNKHSYNHNSIDNNKFSNENNNNNSNNSLELVGNSHSRSNSNVKLVLPRLISTRNVDLHVRGGEEEEDKYKRNSDVVENIRSGKFSEMKLDSGWKFNNEIEEEENEEWFGGFSR